MTLKDPIARAEAYSNKYRVQKKQHYQDNREEMLARAKQNYEDKREEILIKRKQHYAKRLLTGVTYYQEHREERAQYSKDNPEVGLKSMKKQLTRIGKLFDLSCEQMRYALLAWAETIKKRDDHKCTRCNSTENLRAHHIWHKVFCPESALDIENGITLCHECHMEQHRLDRSF